MKTPRLEALRDLIRFADEQDMKPFLEKKKASVKVMEVEEPELEQEEQEKEEELDPEKLKELLEIYKSLK